MAKRKKKGRAAPGTAPGTLIADPNAPKPVVQAIVYDEKSCDSYDVVAAGLPALYAEQKKIWPIRCISSNTATSGSRLIKTIPIRTPAAGS